MIDQKHLTRFWDLIPDESRDTPIVFVGAGAIGSQAILMTCKMGYSHVTAIDFDTVEVENIGTQLYPFSSIGKLKVDALREIVKDFTGETLKTHACRWEDLPAGALPSGRYILVSCLDSMAVRKTLWESVKENPACRMFVDSRMGAEVGLFYAMQPCDPDDITAYETTLYSDEDAVQERCTSRATIYCSAMLGALVAQQVKNLACGFEYVRTASWSVKNAQFSAWRKGGAAIDSLKDSASNS